MSRWYASSLALILGCSTAPLIPPSAPTASSAVTTPASSAPEEPQGPVTAPTPLPVAAPLGLLLEAKSRPLGTTAKELGKLMGLPVELLLSVLGPGVLRADAGLGAVVLVSERSSNGPVPPLSAAFSVPVTDAGAFSQALERDKGRWRPKGVGFVLREGPLKGLFCKATVALGDATTRAVCGPSEEDVGEVAPYLTRGLPSVDLGPGDLRIRVKFAPLKPWLSSPLDEIKQKQSDLLSGGRTLLLGRLLDVSLVTAPVAVVDEGLRFIEAQESATFGVQINGETKVIDLSGTWSFSSRGDSWLVRLVTSRTEQGPAPEAFWRLPRESEVALFGRGVDGEMQDEPRRVVRKVTGALLSKLGLPDAELKSLDEALASLPRGDTPWALGAGRQGQEAWWVLGSEGDAALFPTWLRRSGRALKQLAALAKRSGGQVWKDAVAELRVEESPAGFPAGSVLIETNTNLSLKMVMEFLLWGPGGVGGGHKPERWVLVATPEGKGRSWLGVASARAPLKARLRQVTARGAGKDLLGAEEGLGALRSGKSGFGGRLVAGNTLRQVLAEEGIKVGTGEGKGEVPVVLQGGVEAGKIEGKVSVPGVLLAELLEAVLKVRSVR